MDGHHLTQQSGEARFPAAFPPAPAFARTLRPAPRRRLLPPVSPAVWVSALFAALMVLVPVLRGAAKLPLLAVLAPLVLVTAFRKTEVALYVYIAWCWCDGAIRGVFSDDAASILARDVVMLVIVAGWFLRRRAQERADPLLLPPMTLAIALFALDCVAQFANPYHLGLSNSLAGLKIHLSAIPLYFVAYDVFREKRQLRELAVFLTLITLVACAILLVQYHYGRTWTFAHYYGTDKIGATDLQLYAGGQYTKSELDTADFRPPGATSFGGGTGAFAALVAPLTFALLLAGRERRLRPWQRLMTGGALLVFIATIFLGGLREALVEAVVGVLICALVCGGRLRWRAGAALVACALMGLVAWGIATSASHGALAGRWGSLFSNPVQALHSDRKTFIDQIGLLTVDSPLGVGLGRGGAAGGHLGRGDSHLGFYAFSEAYFGFLILETGIPGMLLIAAVVFAYVGRSLQAVRQLPLNGDDRLLASALAGILAVVMFNCFFSPILAQPPGSVMFWLCCGVVGRCYAVERARARARRAGALPPASPAPPRAAAA